MDLNINNGLRAHAFIESFKTEALDTCASLIKDSDKKFTSAMEDFVLKTVDELVIKFDATKAYTMDSYQLQIIKDDGDIEADSLFVKADEVNEILDDFRNRFNTVLLQLVVYKLGSFLMIGEE